MVEKGGFSISACLVKKTRYIMHDMEEIDIHPWMWLQKRDQHFVKHATLYVFTSNGNQIFLKLVAFIKASTCYVATFEKHVGGCKLLSMKFRDHRVMIQQILLMCVRHLLMYHVRQIIIIFLKKIKIYVYMF